MNNINFNYENKIVLIFGGSRGIGAEVCKCFVDTGAKVYCVSRTPSKIDKVVDIKCDISKSSEINKVFEKFEKIDFVINVAGTNLCVPIGEIQEPEWDRLMNVNLKSFF